MTESVEIKGLLDRLGRQFNQPVETKHPFEVPTTHFSIAVYKSQGAWPGESYILIGHTYHKECLLLGTDLESRRAGCFTLMLAQSREVGHCITVEQALSYEGFVETLSQEERSWLSSLPSNTLLGPSYHRSGSRTRTSLAVWKHRDATDRPKSAPEIKVQF